MPHSNSRRSPKEHGKNNNLIPNSERSPEELREMGRKGGISSGEARRKKRDLQKSAKLWLEVFEDLEKQDGTKAGEILDILKKEALKHGRSPSEPRRNTEYS